MEIFDCNSSIFFAIMEALFDKNRRTLIPGPSVPDEIEVRDIISELCFAGADILEGNCIYIIYDRMIKKIEVQCSLQN